MKLANHLVDDLLEMQIKGGPWGYEFDVQTRWGYYPKGSPNVVATAYALRAISSVDRIEEVSDSVREWLGSLWDPRGFFRYTLESDALIHNGSLLAAESLARLGGFDDRIPKAIETTVSAQDDVGSWPYGRGAGLEWKDSFHTIYVMDSLSFLEKHGFDIGTSVETGLEYWKQHFFTEAMRPTYFADSKAPSRDVHNVATVAGAMIDYRKFGLDQHFIDSVLGYLVEFQANDGGFRNSANSLPFMRWNQGHAFLALSKHIAAARN
ncbi:hypothetical protein ACIPUB_14035 [Paeniglutamicibacter sp. ORCA_105]|uniref:hypothetical protein n=1 Tax=Paeniglutamicibacter sp. ORCA_105 TaxID=3377336 RepID=UPI0038953375